MQASPETANDGRTIWYGASSDITSLVDYLVSIEQILFDIAHVLRRPVASMLGITEMINGQELDESEIKECASKLHTISLEMDRISRELNTLYNEKRQEMTLSIDIHTRIDKRKNMFQ